MTCTNANVSLVFRNIVCKHYILAIQPWIPEKDNKIKIYNMLLTNPPQHLTLGFTSFTSGAKTGYLCIPEGKGRKCVSVTSSVSLLGFKPIHIFITQAKADCNTVHTVAFSTQSEPRGVTLLVSGFPANVQLLRSASPGVLHDCSFKRSNLILYITQRAKGRSS